MGGYVVYGTCMQTYFPATVCALRMQRPDDMIHDSQTLRGILPAVSGTHLKRFRNEQCTSS